MSETVGIEVNASTAEVEVEGIVVVGVNPFAVTDHGQLTGLADDDHPQYQRESEKGAASGYASLDGAVKVPVAQVPTGTTGTTVALGNHLHGGVYEPAGTVATHAAAADPHTGYQKESEKGQASGYASLDGTGKVPSAQLPASGGGVTDHGLLTGLGDDDHPQYLRGAEVLAGFDIAVTQGAGVVTIDSETRSNDTLYYAWSNATTGAPADGTIRANNLTASAVTQLALSERTADSTDTAGLIANITTGHTLAVKNRLSAVAASHFNVTGPAVDQGTYWTVPVAYAGGNGSFPGNTVSVAVLWGHPGGTYGSAGGVGSGISPALIDAKGDLIVGSAADTVARLPVGTTTGHVLKVNPAAASGLEWGEVSGGGAAAGVLLFGYTAPTGGADGDWFVRAGTGTREVGAVYGPKAAGAWPPNPDFFFGSHGSTVFTNTNAGDGNVAIDNIAATYPASAGGGFRIGFSQPVTAPTPNVSHVSNVAYSNGIKRGASVAVGFWTGEAFTGSFGMNLPMMAHAVATVAAPPNGTSTSRMGVGFYNAAFTCGQYAYITPAGKFGLWAVSAAAAMAEVTPSSAPAPDDIIAVQFLGQYAQAQLFSAARVLKCEVKAPRGGITNDTAYGNRMGVVFDSTDDTTGKLSNFWGVC